MQNFRGRWLILIWILLSHAAPHSSLVAGGRGLVQKDAVLYNKQGLELSKAGKFEEAVKAFKQAIKLKPDYDEAHFNLGDAYAQQQQYDKAIEEYKLALRYKPDLLMAYNNMGTAHYRLGEHKKAIAAYEAALKLDPKRGLTHFNIAAARLAGGDKQGAIAQYQALKAIDPSLAEKLYLLIYKPTVNVFDAGGTERVRLNLVVTDAQGALVKDLKQEDFRVSEEGVPQTIQSFSRESAPLAYGLLVDNSGSFRPVLDVATDAAKEIVHGNVPLDETFLIRFVDSQKIETVLDFTSNKALFDPELDKLYIEGGHSAIVDALYLAALHAAEYKVKDAVYRRRALVVLTDGEERDSYYRTDKLVETLRRVDVQVYPICLTATSLGSTKFNRNLPERSRNFLLKLAQESGGQAFFPQTRAELQAILSQLTAILRTQYVIEYKPEKPAPIQSYRTVSVEVVGPPERAKSTVTTRAGYLIPEPTPAP